MALASTTVWEVRTGGSDTVNGGAFDPGQTAGMFTDGAATSATTSAPVFSSASYNFVAGDVGAWIYVASGTNWIPGWYKIASVAANQATLNATIGQANLNTSFAPTTVTGCATVASPTSATWSIDYSQQDTAQFAYTDLASVGAGLLVSSAAKPFAKQQVGNSIIITGGTNFTTGTYVIASVAAAIATVVGPGNITTGAGVNGTGGQGGGLASPAVPFAIKIAGNSVWVKSGTYNVTTASTNVANGCIANGTSDNGTQHFLEGYGSIRADAGTAPILLAGNAISSFTMFSTSGGTSSNQTIKNITFDGASLTTSRGISNTRSAIYDKVTVKNCTNDGFNVTGNSYLFRCVATGCGGTSGTHFGINFAGGNTGAAFACEAYSNTVGGIRLNNSGHALTACLSYNNSGASSDGFSVETGQIIMTNCVAYGNGRDGFRQSVVTGGEWINCIAEANTGVGFNRSSVAFSATYLYNCAAYNNTSSNINTTSFPFSTGFVTGSGSFFTNPGSGDLSLNNTAGAGAAARAAGYPGVFLAGTTTGYIDIGGAQHADPAGSGGGIRLAGRGGLAMGA